MNTIAQLGRLAARQVVKQAAVHPGALPMPMTGPTNIGMRFGSWLGSKLFGSSKPAAGSDRKQPWYPTKLTGEPPPGAYTSPVKQYGPGRYTGPNYRPYPAYPGDDRHLLPDE